MPMSFSITKEDLMRSKAVKPGLYLLTIKNISQGPGKNDPSSTVTTIDFEIKDSTAGDKEFIGVPVKHWISEKAAGYASGFFEAVTGKKITDGMQVPDLAQLIGRDVKGYIKNDIFNGRPTNKVDGFMTA